MVEFQLGDIIRLKKPHPCGSSEWLVTRLGADIGLECRGCRRHVLLPRRTLEQRFRGLVSGGK